MELIYKPLEAEIPPWHIQSALGRVFEKSYPHVSRVSIHLQLW